MVIIFQTSNRLKNCFGFENRVFVTLQSNFVNKFKNRRIISTMETYRPIMKARV